MEVLHCDESSPVEFTNVVSGANIWVAQRAGGARFTPESFSGRGIVHKFGRQEFERNGAAQPYVLGAINHSHPSSAQLLDNAIVGEGLADEDRVPVLTRAAPLLRHQARGNFHGGPFNEAFSFAV